MDDLPLGEAVVGDGVLLIQPREGGLLLYAIEMGEANLLGRFDQVADAWSALDAFDLARG